MSDEAHSTVAVAPPLPAEEQARADVYAVLARLFVAPPDASFLHALAHASGMGLPTVLEAEGPAGRFGEAWDRLRAASSVMDPQAAQQEYADLFLGVGRSQVNLHASHWTTGFMMDKPLVEVRAALARLGLGRRPDASIVEDHLGALFETMRLLVAGDGERPPAALFEQQRFFARHISPWAERCCIAITNCGIANYYARVAELTESFVALERDSFAIGIA